MKPKHFPVALPANRERMDIWHSLDEVNADVVAMPEKRNGVLTGRTVYRRVTPEGAVLRSIPHIGKKQIARELKRLSAKDGDHPSRIVSDIQPAPSREDDHADAIAESQSSVTDQRKE